MDSFASQIERSRNNVEREARKLWETTNRAGRQFAAETGQAAASFGRCLSLEADAWKQFASRRLQRELERFVPSRIERDALQQVDRVLRRAGGAIRQRLAATAERGGAGTTPRTGRAPARRTRRRQAAGRATQA
ncbi:MAG: hypothetical protein NZ898_02465 [Myxococcota bacterium]|nr:hypothetical protein [Myxococcota bacterium]MDW8362622.1 hypothetical protein [Myxococcales bacterium]